jgi:hypothetical protein
MKVRMSAWMRKRIIRVISKPSEKITEGDVRFVTYLWGRATAHLPESWKHYPNR